MVAVAKLGVVYTPREVTRPMVERALAPLVAGKSPTEILALRVCDFAIGEGAFLVEIVRFLAAAHGGRDAKRLVAAHCLHGADIDPVAVATARAVVERFAGAPVPELARHLRVGDSLAVAWGAFDAVIGNPPYIRQEKLAPAHKTALRSYESYDGVADLYVYFIELAHRLLRPGGRYCVVVPTKWLTAAYARPLRAFLARQQSVEQIEALPPASFATADAFPCVVSGATCATGHRPLWSPKENEGLRDRTCATGLRPLSGEPWHLDDREDARVIARWDQFPTLGETLTPSRGVVTGCNRAFVISGETRERLVAADRACAAWIRPFLKGRDVRRWSAAPSDRYLLVHERGSVPPQALRTHLAPLRAALEPGTGRKPGSYKWYELQDPVGALAKSRGPRLFYQDIQTAPACALDRDGLVPDTTVWILDTDDPFLLAVLNSRVYQWYARRRFPPALNGAVRPKREYMMKLPLPRPAPPLRARIVALVTAQLAGPTAARDRELDALICRAYGVSASLIT